MKKILIAFFLMFGVFVCFQAQAEAKHPSKQIVVGYGHRIPAPNMHKRMPPPPPIRHGSVFDMNIGYPMYSYSYYPYPVPYYNYPYGNIGASIRISI